MLFEKTVAYLIDTENVGSTWIDLLASHKKMDLHLFVTENAKNLNFSLLHEITENKNKNKYTIHDCKIGKNSLDFYLSSYLGYLIGKNANSEYVIVSQDTGYDNVIEFWTNKGFKISRIDTKPAAKKKENTNKKKKTETQPAKPKETKKEEVKKESTPKKKTSTKKKETKLVFLSNKLPEKNSVEVEKVKNILDSVKSKASNDVYVALVKELKQEDGLNTYNAIKKSLKKYYTLSD
ncbi:MAG: PIN domain-containing protein [Erysipelotrichaceae bacterium]|nr:PIN domain-containing protein [Erysipelotrichaceae bacterium]